MKKQLFGLLVAGLLLGACSQEEVTAPADGGVTFNVSLQKGISSRVISDGTQATKLIYQVYDGEGNARGDQQQTTIDGSATVRVEGLTAGSYTIAFWAQSPSCVAYNTADLKAVSVDYQGILNNDEALDAFCGAFAFTAGVDTEIDATLRRPFAQINVGFTGIGTPEYTTTQMAVSDACGTLNVVDGTVANASAVTFGYNALPAETLTVSDAEYTYESMTYLLVGKDKTTVNLTLRCDDGEAEYTYDNVPVQRNYRTNILGTFAGTTVTFEIEIDADYLDPDLSNPEEEEPASNIVDVTPSYYKFNSSSTTGASYLSEMFRWSVKQANAPNISNNFISENTNGGANYFTTAGLAKGNVLRGAWLYNNDNSGAFVDAAQIHDFGGKIGKALVLNGYGSTINEAIAEKMGVANPGLKVYNASNFTLNFNLMWVVDYLKMAGFDRVRVRMEFNAFANDMTTGNALTEIGYQNDNATMVYPLATETFSPIAFSEFAQDGEWNPYRWMVFEVDMKNIELPCYVRTINSAGFLNYSLLIRNIEIFVLSDDDADGRALNTPVITWNEYK